MHHPIPHSLSPIAHVLRSTRPALALSALVLLAYMPLFSAQLLLWDDASFITHNYRIHHLSLATISDLFRLKPIYGPHPFALFTPLTELTAALEYLLAGPNPRVFHVTNILLHLISTLLFSRLLRSLGVSFAPAWFAAAAFAVHPLQVESVAWIAQRKNLLSLLFSLATLYLHIQWRLLARRPYFLGALFCALCALLSKPTAVALPLALLAYDVSFLRLRFLHSLRMHLPLCFAALIIVLINYHLQHTSGALAPLSLRTAFENLAVAAHALVLYIAKFLFPLHLAPVYPRSNLSPHIAWWILVVPCLTALIYCTRHRLPLFSLGLLWYVILNLPTLQLIPTGLQILAADRFFYLPSLGLLSAAAALIDAWLTRSSQLLTRCALLALVLSWAFLTHAYARVWHDDLSLWSYTRRVFPTLALPQKYYAIALYQAGCTNEALPLLRSISQRQQDFRVFTLLADAEYSARNLTQALHWANAAVASAPSALAPRFLRALVLSSLNLPALATSDWYAVLALQPLHPRPPSLLAADLLALGLTNSALTLSQSQLAPLPSPSSQQSHSSPR
ncbi:MAG: hypothetical protein N2595_08180 [bacterium]|nr:hypothetical protein [bacterium]